ncbi:hypothetical protein BASA81_006201 [Batrachochytrium salamandrivorans]|nr:hypothetical protein BASA81_006201 [Batrachochytrium salamandrivorans]
MTQFVCNTSKGEVEITLVREWSPLGVERFEQLVDDGFFTNIPLSRCIEGFLCQFGYKPSSSQLRAQEYGTILDDVPNPATPREFKRGYLSFAGNGANSRSQHLFVTLGQQVKSLGTMPWETPIGYVSSHSMQSVVSKFETKYGDQGPDPNRVIAAKGNEYLSRHFPDLDYLHSCRRKLVVISVELGPNLGAVEIELHPEWAPLGVNRLLDMIRARFLDEARVFRVVPGFVVQFGMPADPKRGGEFPQIKDDPVKQSNKRGTITFCHGWTKHPDISAVY